MTDTPDALMDLITPQTVPGVQSRFAIRDAVQALCIDRDAAIKRVAELERDVKTGIEAARAATTAYTLFTDRVTLAATGYEKQIADLTADLAAARAEIERKDAALRLFLEALMSVARTALAPKEPNNG